MALSPIVNYLTPFLNPSYASQWTPDIYWRLVMYWHGGIFIPWITTLAALCCMAFKLDKMGGRSGKLITDSVLIGGIFAVPIAGIAGIFDIFDNYAMGVPLWTQIFAFLIGDEMAIALIIAMLNQPRVSGHGYLRAGLPFYVVLVGICSALVSAMMGHVGGWITWFGPNPSLVSQYISGQMTPALGFYNSTSIITFTENVVTSHSHLMLPALMAGVIGLVAAFYGYDKWSANEKLIAGFGFLVMIGALFATNWIYVVSGVGNYATPTLFVSGPAGANGIAADDVITGIVGIGGFFVLLALLMESRRGTTHEGVKLLKDPLFLSIIVSWITIYLVIPVTGYYIEMNEFFYQAGGMGFDDAFNRFHQDFGFFLLPALVSAALALGAFQISGKTRKIVGYLFMSGVAMAFVFGEIYAMFTLNPVALYLAALGGIMIGIGLFEGVLYLARRPKAAPTIVQTKKELTQQIA